jgi:hypothetical protein
MIILHKDQHSKLKAYEEDHWLFIRRTTRPINKTNCQSSAGRKETSTIPVLLGTGSGETAPNEG